MDSLFNKVAGFQVCIFIKKRLQHRRFLVKFAKLLRTPFFYRTHPMDTSETKHTHASAADLLHIRIGNLNWNESYEKETIHIHASAANIVHIRI